MVSWGRFWPKSFSRQGPQVSKFSTGVAYSVCTRCIVCLGVSHHLNRPSKCQHRSNVWICWVSNHLSLGTEWSRISIHYQTYNFDDWHFCSGNQVALDHIITWNSLLKMLVQSFKIFTLDSFVSKAIDSSDHHIYIRGLESQALSNWAEYVHLSKWAEHLTDHLSHSFINE